MSFNLLGLHFLRFDLYLLVFNIQTQVIVDTHVLVRDPDQRKKSNEVPAPIRIEEFEAGYREKECRHVVAETIFARKEVKEFAPRQRVGAS